MKKSKNLSFTIGAFIAGAIGLVFLALLFFSGGKYFTEKEKVIMYFDGSVQGLQVGAPVKLKGVEIGQITDIQINFQNDNKTIVNAVTADLVIKKINSKGTQITSEFFDEAIKNGLRAQLNFQSFLTGLLYVELDFYPETAIKLRGEQKKYREIPTVATQFEELSKTISEIDIKGIARNIDEFTTELNNLMKSGQIQTTIKNINSAAVSIEKTSNNIDTQITALGKNVEKTRAEIDKLLLELNTRTPEIAKSLEQSLQELRYTLEQVNKTASSIEGTVSEDSPLINQLNDTLIEVSRSAQSFRNLTEAIEQQPESLLRGKTPPNKDK